jgi:hypothetical protein
LKTTLCAREINQINQLAEFLCQSGYSQLAEALHWLTQSRRSKTYSLKWQLLMAKHIAKAIHEGKTLCTASLARSRLRGQPPPVGIFVIEEDTISEDLSYVFTSVFPKVEKSESIDPNDLNRHVSIEVDLFDLQGQSMQRPKLYTKRWIQGLYFFHGHPPSQFLYPWPASLQDLHLGNFSGIGER